MFLEPTAKQKLERCKARRYSLNHEYFMLERRQFLGIPSTFLCGSQLGSGVKISKVFHILAEYKRLLIAFFCH